MSRIQPGSGYGFTSGGYGFTLNTSDPFPQQFEFVQTHPLKIVNVSIVVSGGSPKVRYQVVAGTLNNLVPTLDDYITGTPIKLDRVNPTTGLPNPPTEQLASTNFNEDTKTTYITLRSGAKTTTPFEYPDSDVASNRYPQIIAGNDPAVADEDAYGFLFLGTITVDSVTTPTTFTVNQYISGSLWGDRMKLGTTTARYYYARI